MVAPIALSAGAARVGVGHAFMRVPPVVTGIAYTPRETRTRQRVKSGDER